MLFLTVYLQLQAAITRDLKSIIFCILALIYLIFLTVFFFLLQKLQKFLDDITPFRTARWIAAFVLIMLFMIRIIMLQVWKLQSILYTCITLNYFIMNLVIISGMVHNYVRTGYIPFKFIHCIPYTKNRSGHGRV